MKALFIHQNFPGQFRHIARHLAENAGWTVVGLGEAKNLRNRQPINGITTVAYPYRAKPSQGHPYLASFEEQVRRGQAVLRALLVLRKKGFVPDVICVHSSWGEALFLREAYPHARIINYAEFHYGADGADAGFDPEFPAPKIDGRCQLRMRNSSHLHALADCDAIWTPTRWQASRLPGIFRSRANVIHEGINTRAITPDPAASFQLGDRVLTQADTILTYAARNLEPYRGFHRFMRALPRMLAEHPQAEAVIVGGDEVSYGRRPIGAKHWRAQLLKEVGADLDLKRVHFIPRLPHADYLNLLRISRAHVYLTYPFVLSWSLLEAMACGCPLVASRTAPVQEVIVDGQNGLLVDFFDGKALASAVGRLLKAPEWGAELGGQARRTVEGRFDLHHQCLPRQAAMFEAMRVSAKGSGVKRRVAMKGNER